MKKILQKGIAQIVILGVMGLLAVVLPIVTKLVQQNQENRSQAATMGTTCSVLNDKQCCSGNVCTCLQDTPTKRFWMKTKDCGSLGCSGSGVCNAAPKTCTVAGKTISIGQFACDGSTQVECMATGQGYKPCGTIGCDIATGKCKTACTPGQKICTSTIGLKECNSTGTDWKLVPCPWGCDTTKNECKSGTNVCGNYGTLSECNNAGCSWSYNGNYCQVCTNNTQYKCDGRNLMKCNSGGSGWVLSRECGIDQTCNATTKTCESKSGVSCSTEEEDCDQGYYCDPVTKKCKVGCETIRMLGRSLALGAKTCGNTGTSLKDTVISCSVDGKLDLKNCPNGCIQKSTLVAECKPGDGNPTPTPPGSTTYSLTVNPLSLTLAVGGGSTVTPILTPQRTVESFAWTSSDSTVATVYIPKCSDNTKSTVLTDKSDNSAKCDGTNYYLKDGVKQCTKCVGANYAYVHAVKEGTTTITVVASPSGAQTTIQVTVTGAGGSITGITLSPDPVNLKVAESKQVTVSTIPAGLSATYEWESGDANVASVDINGKVTGVKVGEANIKATVEGKEISKTVKAIVTEGAASDVGVSFKVAFAGISPNAECINEYFIPETRLKLEVNNVPTNKFDDTIQSSFEKVDGGVDSKGNQIFKVTQTLDENKFGLVDNFNYVKVKGPWHLKRRMCQDGQSGKLSETTVCDIDLKSGTGGGGGKVYDFSGYTLLAGDAFDPPNGVVDSQDLSYIKTRMDSGAEITCGIEGDLNLDGVVNSGDLGLVRRTLQERDDE